MTAEDDTVPEPEVGPKSVWFLRGLTIAVAVVVLAFIVHAATGLFGGDDSSSTAIPVASTTTTVGATTTTAPAPTTVPTTTTTTTALGTTTTEAAVDGDVVVEAFVDEAMAFIEGVRGEPFPQRPALRVVGEHEFLAILRADLAETFAEDPDLVEEATAIYQSLGLIGPDERIDDVYDLFVEAGVLGVYFPDTDEMVVRAGPELTLLTQSTIVHELVHAYDDLRFDLERMDSVDDSTELGWSFSAAAEGSASYIEALWVDTLTAAQRNSLTAEELGFGDPSLFERFDISFLLLQISVYDYGERWIRRLVERDGVTGIDAAILDPALTSEQVIEPLDAPGRQPIVVDPPAIHGNVVWQGAGGQVLLDALFTGSFTGGSEASTGWGGDSATVYELDGRSCIRWDIATDSPSDLKELLAGLTEWADARGGTVTQVGDLVRLDRCA